MTTAQNTNATLAALAIFNGLGLSPINASPRPGLVLVGPAVPPRFTQVRNYLSRFFSDTSTTADFCPVETLGAKMAAAQWVRGAVGILQHALYEELGLDLPDASAIDPAAWWRDLDDMVAIWSTVEPEELTPLLVGLLLDAWQESSDDAPSPGTRKHYIAGLYQHARELQAQEAFLTNVPAIAKARKTAAEEDAKTA